MPQEEQADEDEGHRPEGAPVPPPDETQVIDQEENAPPRSHRWSGWTFAGFVLYWNLLKDWPAHRASLIVLLTPVVAVVAGLAAGERLTAAQWLGGATVLAGVALSLTQWRPGRAAQESALAARGPGEAQRRDADF